MKNMNQNRPNAKIYEMALANSCMYASLDELTNPYNGVRPYGKPEVLSPELAYSHEKTKLFNKFGY